MVKEFWINDESKGINLRLPVTPPNFSIEKGNKIEVINVTEIGDLNIVGNSLLSSISIDSFFPNQDYSYSFPATIDITDIYDYTKLLETWKKEKQILRFIITGTDVNMETKLEKYKYGEQDGTGDIYFTITLREYRRVATPSIQSSGIIVNEVRSTGNAPKPANKTYTVIKGDTLWAIAKYYYGNGSLHPKISQANNLKNPNLIYPGQVLIIP